MNSLIMLCQKYIEIDDELTELRNELTNTNNALDKIHLEAVYLKKYVEREDFKSGMRRVLINELVNGVYNDE